MIYISTGGYKKVPVSKTVENLNYYKIQNFELSGGQFSSTQSEDLKNLSKTNLSGPVTIKAK